MAIEIVDLPIENSDFPFTKGYNRFQMNKLTKQYQTKEVSYKCPIIIRCIFFFRRGGL